MAFITGSATSLYDLFDQIQGHLVDEGWTVRASASGQPAPNNRYLYVTGPGFGPGYEVSFAMRTHENAPNNIYCIELRGMTDYDGDAVWGQHPGSSPLPTFMRVWNTNMEYWLAISNRRFMIVVKCSNTYHSMYAGFFNAFANPPEYPYPFYMGADSPTPGPFGAVENVTRSMASPGINAAFIREPGGMWRPVAVYSETTSGGGFQRGGNGSYTMWPYLALSDSVDLTTTDYNRPPYVRGEELPGLPGSLWLMNCYIIGTVDDAGVIGGLEGVYWIPGNTISAEQVFTVDGDSYRAFINISRSVESPNQFYAVREL